jgi:hypothetical protein
MGGRGKMHAKFYPEKQTERDYVGDLDTDETKIFKWFL